MSAESSELNLDQKLQLVAKLLRDKSQNKGVACPLSYGQQSLWFIHQLDSHSSAYNVMYAARLRSDVNRTALSRAFAKLLQHHAALRTTYGAETGEAVQ